MCSTYKRLFSTARGMLEKEDFELQEAMIKAPCTSTIIESLLAKLAIISCTVLHQLDQKIIYPHYDFKHLTKKYFEIGMKLDDFLIQLVKYCI